MTTYLLNTPVLTSYGEYRFSGPLTIDRARSLIQSGWQSAIGHEGAATFLSSILGVLIPTNRVAIAMNIGDCAIILRIKTRLPEGKVLNADEMANIPFELGLLERVN